MAVQHDERPTRRQLTSASAVVTPDHDEDATVATRVSPLLAQFFGGEVPVRFVFWDGSALGRDDGPRVSPKASRASAIEYWKRFAEPPDIRHEDSLAPDRNTHTRNLPALLRQSNRCFPG